MDLLTDVVIPAAISGAAGQFVTQISTNGIKWLRDLLTAQSPEMQEMARKNLENFVVRLAKRVERLEQEIPADKSEIFENALNHPGSALLIKNAMIDSATTDNEDKHEILSELIAQRLSANADDMIALAGAAACSVVNCLSSRQIKLLAILTTIKDIRPLQTGNVIEPATAKLHINNWWSNNINPLLIDGIAISATALDYEHLAAMGCIRISIGSTNLVDIVSRGFFEPEHKFSESEFQDQIWYKSLEAQWSGLGHSTSTSVGRLIGILHRDAKLKTNTKINW